MEKEYDKKISAKVLALRMMEHEEKLIAAAIKSQTGEEVFDLNILKHRGIFLIQPDGTKVFYFDDVALIHFMKIKYKTEEKNGSFVISAEQPYLNLR